MGRYVVGFVAAAVLAVGGWFGWAAYSTPPLPTLGNERASADLVGTAVTLPGGQVWPFTPDQQVQAEVIGSQWYVWLVRVNAVAAVDPKQVPEQAKAPTKVRLSAVLKLHYEDFGTEMHLTGLEAVRAAVTPVSEP